MTEDEARFVDAAAALEKILKNPGFVFFLDLILDEFHASRVFSEVPIRQGWTHGEEYAYAKGRRDAADHILTLPQAALMRAKEIIQANQADPLADGDEGKPKYQ